MGRREKLRRQEQLWIAHTELPRTVAHPFYEQLNRVLEGRGFDEFVEQQCSQFYAEKMGRPSLAPVLLENSYRAFHWQDSNGVEHSIALVSPGVPKSIASLHERELKNAMRRITHTQLAMCAEAPESRRSRDLGAGWRKQASLRTRSIELEANVSYSESEVGCFRSSKGFSQATPTCGASPRLILLPFRRHPQQPRGSKRMLAVCRAGSKVTEVLAQYVGLIHRPSMAKSPLQCAGINRHEVKNERVLQERSSEPPGPESCAATARDPAKRRQGIGGVGDRASKRCNPDADVFVMRGRQHERER